MGHALAVRYDRFLGSDIDLTIVLCSKVALTLSGGHADAVYSVAWSNDGSLIATGSADRTVCKERNTV